MDFVERWFGVWPDGGNGSLEVVALLLVLVVACAAVFRGELHGWSPSLIARHTKPIVLLCARLMPVRFLMSTQYVSNRAHNRTRDT
jgi:hypothetical protein